LAKISPFKAVLPVKDKAHLVATRSYINYSKKHLKSKLQNNPFSFLQIINPDYLSPNPTKNIKKKFKLVREKYEFFKKENIFHVDDSESFYLYRKINENKTYTGIISGVSINDYYNGTIKIHEQTITKREKMFKNYLKATRFNAEPVLITHSHSEELNSLKLEALEEIPEFDFTTTNRSRHQIWKINTPAEIEIITKIFEQIDSLYIADGHHRIASSALLSKGIDKNEAKSFMALLIDEQELNILEFNRLVSSMSNLNTEEFINCLAPSFDIIKINDLDKKNLKKHEIGVYLNHSWYLLKLKPNMIDLNHPVKSLDPQILNDFILEPILDIQDLKTDKRVTFIGGNEPLKTLTKSVDKGKYQIAFILPPISIDELKKVADAGMYMPPKSTYIEPKLRSGLTIYEF